MKKRTAAAIIVTGVAGAVCIMKALRKKRRDNSTLRAQAAIALQEEKHAEALLYLRQISHPTPADLLQMSEAHEASGHAFEALSIITHLLSQQPSIELSQTRLRIHSQLGLYKMALKDLILLNILDKSTNHSEELSDALKAVSSLEAHRHTTLLPPSDILYADFFSTLTSLATIEDPATVFIQSGEYRKCWDLVKEPESDLHRLIKGCMVYVHGNLKEAIAVLADVKNELGRALLFYFLVEKRRQKSATHFRCVKSKCFTFVPPLSAFRMDANEEAKLSRSEDPSVHFYLAKAYEYLEMPEKQQKSLERSLELNSSFPATVYKIILSIKQRNNVEALELIKAAEKVFPEQLNLHCIAIEFFVREGLHNEALEWLCNMERIDTSDPRTHLFKYIVGRAIGKPNPQHILSAIDSDPLYFKTYIYLANHLMDTDRSIEASKAALHHAHGFDEAFTAYQLVCFVETHEEVKRECPSLFMNERIPEQSDKSSKNNN